MMNDCMNEINKCSLERQGIYAHVLYSIFTTILYRRGDGIPYALIRR